MYTQEQNTPADKEWNELFRCVAKMIMSAHAASRAEDEYRNQRYEIRQILMGNIEENEDEFGV